MLNSKGTIRIHERASKFQELLEKDNSVSIHHRNVQKLAIETYKVLHGLKSPPILNNTFLLVSGPYNFRRNETLHRQGFIPSDMAQNLFHFLEQKI